MRTLTRVYRQDMVDDFEARYLAVKSRDPRFDGRLFVAVTSTRIYCRPVCPAMMPRRRNVRFYRYAAVAELAGFRPCRRCRPEASPDSDIRADLVGRGLRLIADGVADRHGSAELSDRLGVSTRHLQRTFKHEIGATPGVIARSRRAKLARQLLAETDVPITEVAFAAGFSSIRAFNETMQRLYKVTPSELRRGGAASSGRLSLLLAYRPPLQTAALLRFLAARAIPGVEEVRGDSYRRSIRFGSGHAVLDVRAGQGDYFTLTIESDRVGQLAHVVQQTRRLLDLDADPEIIDKNLSKSEMLDTLVERQPGLRLPGCFDTFELGVRAILGQQVSVAAATTTAGRLVDSLGTPISKPSGTITALFPTASQVADADLSRLGVPGARKRTIHMFAAAVSEGTVILDGSIEPDEARKQLLALPGVGPWTAEYIAMRALRDPDAFPSTDLGVRHALEHLGADDRSPRELAEQWRPWRGYAAMHLWESLSTRP